MAPTTDRASLVSSWIPSADSGSFCSPAPSDLGDAVDAQNGHGRRQRLILSPEVLPRCCMHARRISQRARLESGSCTDIFCPYCALLRRVCHTST